MTLNLNYGPMQNIKQYNFGSHWIQKRLQRDIWTDVLGEWDSSKQVLSLRLSGVQHLSTLI